MPKERNYNPVQAQRKADKAKEIKKGKSEVAARRNEKLAQRNPERLQRQIDDLKKISSGGGQLTKHEEDVLESLERDLKAVKKAREALGDKAPTFSRGGPRPGGPAGNGVLGKRRRDDDDVSSEDGDVPEDVKRIPMPRDTPPPIPKDVLDQWYAKRRAKRGNPSTNANDTPLGLREGRRSPRGGSQEHTTRAPQVAPVEVKTVYEAKPVLRDLRKEAAAFVPTAVRTKLEKSKGQSGLIEPEEADRLEREGYLKTSVAAPAVTGARGATVEQVEEDDE